MKYSFAFLSLLFVGVAFGGVGVERTPTGVRLVRDGAVAWNFEIATPEGKFAVTATLTRESLSPLVVRQPFCL